VDPYIGTRRGGSTCPLRLVPRQERNVVRRADLEPDEAEHQNPEHNGGRRDRLRLLASARPTIPWN
jgi:hypothetical protein